MNQLESAVIVTNEHGAVATIRFEDPKDDKIISANTKPTLYKLVEDHIKKVQHV